MQQRTDAWYRERAGRITGSRFARAMASTHSDRYRDLIDQLVEERRTGRCQDGGYVNTAMQWGMDHEDHARRWYAKSRSCAVQQIGFVVHPRHDYVGVSPDGLVAHDGLVEIKCPQMKAFRQVLASREMPSRYRWQVQGQLWVCERGWLDFVCFYPPSKGICIRVEADEADFDRLEERCRQIHLEVERRVGSRRTAPSPSPTPRQPAAPAALSNAWRDAEREPARSSKQGIPAWVWIGLVLLALWLLGR